MRGLLIVDVQNDFMPFGSLPVKDGDVVVSVSNELHSKTCFDLVVATQDWHPANHGSFASNHPGHEPGDVVLLAGERQILWPDHCVQNGPGASFHSGLDVARIDAVVRKGTDPEIDSYSGFFDNCHLKDTGLAGLLRSHGIEKIWIVGLATDYCVRWTALDGRSLGFDVSIVVEGVRPVEVSPGDGARALEEMSNAGCRLVSAGDIH